MNYKIYTAALMAVAAGALTSCDLDEYNPSAGTGGDKLATVEGIEGLATYCYEPLYGQLFSSFDYMCVAEGGTDIFFTSASNPNYAKELFYYEGLTTNTNATDKLFGQAYSMINSCNTVVNRAASVVDGKAEDIKMIAAEAKCLRAYYYLILVTNYGNVTLKTASGSESSTLSPVRSTLAEIYQQIVTDLKEAAQDLPVEPRNGEYARVTKKTALGLLARAYAQGAGEDLSENGVSYWKKAQETAEDIIARKDELKVYLHSDVEDLWAQANNRNNKEALFIAAGPDGHTPTAGLYGRSNILTYFYPNPAKLSDIYKTSDKQNYFYGRVNNNVVAPTKYLVDLFDADNDKRWDNSFTVGFGDETYLGTPEWGGSYLMKNKFLVWTEALAAKYGKDASIVGDTIFPLADFDWEAGTWNQYPAKLWPKGDHSGDLSHLIAAKNVYATPYPMDADEDRYLIYLSKKAMTAEEKSKLLPVVINIDDLYDEDGACKQSSFDGTESYRMFPALSKYNWNYDGVFTGDLQRKTGDVMIMRTAEVYLIAAEAAQKNGDGNKAAQYLNVLRERACRDKANFESSMKMSSASEQDVLDEYARELCGEFARWALLKRHKAFEGQLAKANKRAAASFTAKNYWRPISYSFLNQIENADTYGTNGY
jgi:hypothetical protein